MVTHDLFFVDRSDAQVSKLVVENKLVIDFKANECVHTPSYASKPSLHRGLTCSYKVGL